MLLWFGNDRSEYLQTVYQIETMKADLTKMKVDLDRLQGKIRLAESQIRLINTTIEYLRDYASIISLREYSKLKYQLVGEYQVVLTANKEIPPLMKTIKKTESQIEKLESLLPTLSFKVLEFKRG